MKIDQTRRMALPLALFAASVATSAATDAKTPGKTANLPADMSSGVFGLEPSSSVDQSARLQAAIDHAAARGATLVLPAGTYIASRLQLRAGTRISGQGATLVYGGGGVLIAAVDAPGIRVSGLTIEGGMLPVAEALISLTGCDDAQISDVTIRQAGKTAIRLVRVSGRITGCSIVKSRDTAIFSLDAAGLEISHNVVTGAGDNGILVWRSSHGEDATIVAFNRISGITNASGGTGQYGNGIGVYRAGRVSIANNRITDCAYTAIRANEASNVQMTANNVERIGEVALYAEAADERIGASGFEGALIANNIIDTAATGIVVTNFNNGGRLAVIQGNLVRNLMRREHEKVDKRGEGIAVEADAVVSNNVIENAPTCGIMIGWGRHMRDVTATGNLVRRARIGIAVTSDGGAGQCLLAHNMISDTKEGAIRAMDHAKPIGADMVGGKGPRHVVLAGNVAV